jgi:hypothetical protein
MKQITLSNLLTKSNYENCIKIDYRKFSEFTYISTYTSSYTYARTRDAHVRRCYSSD